MTDNRLISLASGTLPEFDPVAVVEAAAAGGFAGCGVWFDAGTWTKETTRDVRNAFDLSGLTPLEIEVIMVGEAFDFTASDRVFEAGAEIGCSEAIIVSMDADQSRFTDAFNQIAEQANGYQINACLEFLPIFSVANLDQALAVLEATSAPNARLLLDPIHVQRSGATIKQLSMIDPGLISFAQFCDGVAELPDFSALDTEARWNALRDDAVDGRSCPGEGNLPLEGFVEALPGHVPLSMELRSSALREKYPDPAERAKTVFTATENWLRMHELP